MYPFIRGRRTRASQSIRDMVREHEVRPSDLIAPMFVMEGRTAKQLISSMPGYFRYSPDLLIKEARTLFDKGIRSVLLFGMVPENKKDNKGTEAVNPNGLLPQTVKKLKDAIPELHVMTDVALDPFSSYGHDGIVEDGKIINDKTTEVLAQMSVVHAKAGADMVAPSDMMDGRIYQIRQALEENGFHDTGIMAYSAKYASVFYGPFRDALDSAPGFGDKKTYQMDPANVQEAIREAQLDEDEGADIVMVKPGLPYLDVVRAVKETVEVPVAVYNVSGEYSMVKAAGKEGWLDEQAVMMESLLACKRAGADLIASYFAPEAVDLLQ